MNKILHRLRIKDIDLQFYDYLKSSTVRIVADEINNNAEYEIAFRDNIFNEGDEVIDIGGNVGMFSILLAKKYPFLKIFAFEPVFENWRNFKRNIRINEVKNIKLFYSAVSGDGSLVKMEMDSCNSGASSMINELNSNKLEISRKETVKSVTLSQILSANNITKCKLLKIDCEGAEFEIFYKSNPDILRKIEYIIGETHSFDKQQNNRKALLKYLENFLPTEKIQMHGW